MCRHLAYLGAPVTLSELLLAPPHSLSHQSWAPTEMRGGGTINADGFGVGWFPEGGGPPVRYRRSTPMWSDASFASVAGGTRSGAVLAAVRSATEGMPVTETACAPFGEGRWLFSHNGTLPGWPEAVSAVAAQLPVSELLTLDAPTDSALIWALVRARLLCGYALSRAVATTVVELLKATPTARLNLLLTDGETVVATTVGHSLWSRPGAVASEAYDADESWSAVPDHQIITLTRTTTTMEPL